MIKANAFIVHFLILLLLYFTIILQKRSIITAFRDMIHSLIMETEPQHGIKNHLVGQCQCLLFNALNF